MDAPMTVADVLDAAADKLEKPGAWTQGWFARDAAGRETDAESSDANCWCARGAVFAICGTYKVDEEAVFAPLRTELGIELESVEEWNDAPGRTQAEVVAKLREAAAAARRSGDAA